MNLPRYDESQVTPNTLPTPQVPLSDPVAQAVEKIGQTGERVANQGFELARQEKVKADSSVVMDAYKNFSMSSLNLQNDALMKKGKDALNFDPYLEQFDKSYAEAKNKLTPDQQYIFNLKAEHERIGFETTLHRHANEQGQALNIENAKSVVDISEQKLSTGYRDEANYDVKNPQSQINQLRASTADLLHVQGIGDKDPAFKDAIDSVTSKAYVDRIKLLMTDRPTEANTFFKAHENEIEPKEREQLGKAVARAGDEKLGIDTAFEMLQDIKDGKKSRTDLEAELHEKFKDNPEAFKYAKAQMHDLFTQVKADEVNLVAGVGTKIEAAVDKAVGQGQIVSLKLLKSIPEFNELEKLAASGNKSAETELNRMKSYTSKTEHMQKQERKAEASEAKRNQVVDRQNFMLDVGDPNTLRLMNKTDLYERGRKAGLSYAQLKTMESSREKAIKDSNSPKEMHNHHIQTTLLPAILEKAQIPENEQEDFGKAWAGAVKAKEDELQRPLTDEEIQQAGLMGIQSHATNSWNPFKAKHEWTEPEKGKTSRTVVEQRKTKDGRILTKYSDGSIE